MENIHCLILCHDHWFLLDSESRGRECWKGGIRRRIFTRKTRKSLLVSSGFSMSSPLFAFFLMLPTTALYIVNMKRLSRETPSPFDSSRRFLSLFCWDAICKNSSNQQHYSFTLHRQQLLFIQLFCHSQLHKFNIYQTPILLRDRQMKILCERSPLVALEMLSKEAFQRALTVD